MCHKATGWVPKRLIAVLLAALAPATLLAQENRTDSSLKPDWRRIGASGVELDLAALAGGPVARVWYSPDGSRLSVETAAGRVFETADFETWTAVVAGQPPGEEAGTPAGATQAPEPGGIVRVAGQDGTRVYASGGQVHRSDDGGQTWVVMTSYRGRSILGGKVTDMAVSPANADEVVVANDFGVWRSVDGGLAWRGLNDSLPNLPVRRILGLPSGTTGVMTEAGALGVIEWAPGERQAWRQVEDARQAGGREEDRIAAERSLGVAVSVAARTGDVRYAGSMDGRIWVSLDGGVNWRLSRPAMGGRVEAIYVDPDEPRIALAALEPAGSPGGQPRVLRTANTGVFWDDITGDLPPGGVHAVIAHRPTGSVYVAAEGGVFYARASLLNPGPAPVWTSLESGLPRVPALDVQLDAGGNQIYVALEGYGVYAALAPHRWREPGVVHAADLVRRAAAPGLLLSVLGRKVERAWAGNVGAPVLAASETESQIQVPFEVAGSTIALALESSEGRFTVGLPLERASPAIFVDRDGSPLVLDGDSGLLLDAMTPARSSSRLQILAAGLGKVTPEWLTGAPAPLDDPPHVAAPVRVYLDRQPLEVTRAILAPGYVGFYLVEAQLPRVVNAGPAELYLETGGQASNRVRIYLEP